ncbi:MAG: CBS domain-containing protein [Betaproteobacteria bacterium]
MQVREIIRIKGNALFTATPSQSLAAAIETMADGDVGSLVVMENGRMVGMLTFREVLRAVREHSGKTEGVTVADVMISDPVTVAPETDINELRRIMIDTRSRYLPAMDGTMLLGVVSFLDVAKAVVEEQGFENRMLKSYIKHWPEETSAPG